MNDRQVTNQMQRANRGSAQVGLMWTIVMAVIMLASIAFAYFAYDERSKAELDRDNAIAAKETAEQRLATANNEKINISQPLGFQDGSATTPSNPEAAKNMLSRMRELFTSIPADANNFEKAIPFAEAQYVAALQRIQALESQIASLQSEISTARTARNRDLAAKDTEIAGLRDELATERANAEDREQNLNTRLADAEQENDQLDRRVREIEATNEERVRGLNGEIADLRLRNQTLSAKLDLRLQRARVEEPDATVTSVSSTLPLAWINIGTDDRLASGMGFDIRASRLAGFKSKARAVVRRVERNRAEIEIFGLVDRFEPIVPGDVLFSPIYDPVGERTAVLAGRFSGAWDTQRLTMVLAEMGIRVQSNLTGTTDMLITGGEIYYDELGEPLEEPLDPSQLPVYIEAVAGNVTVVPISTLRDYLPASQ